MLNLMHLFDTQVDMSNRQLNVQVWCSGKKYVEIAGLDDITEEEYVWGHKEVPGESL